MIPSTRPVCGKDLDAVKQQFGLSTADACWLFGLSITRWMQIVRQNPNAPLNDPTLALLVRFLDMHPEFSVIPKLPTADEMFDLVNTVAETDQKRFSLLTGSEASACYRWRKLGARQPPAVLRLLYYLKIALLSRGDQSSKLDVLNEWSKMVETEAVARGVNAVFREGRWRPGKAPAVLAPAPDQSEGPKGKRGRRSPFERVPADEVPKGEHYTEQFADEDKGAAPLPRVSDTARRTAAAAETAKAAIAKVSKSTRAKTAPAKKPAKAATLKQTKATKAAGGAKVTKATKAKATKK